MNKKIKPVTPKQRIDFLRKSILSATESHGVPCMCLLCDTLLFDTLMAEGKMELVKRNK